MDDSKRFETIEVNQSGAPGAEFRHLGAIPVVWRDPSGFNSP